MIGVLFESHYFVYFMALLLIFCKLHIYQFMNMTSRLYTLCYLMQ